MPQVIRQSCRIRWNSLLRPQRRS